ncbi:hypothetical protein ABK040_014793 [Willaertia magna]
MFNNEQRSVGGTCETGPINKNNNNSTSACTNYVELYINYMLDKYGSNINNNIQSYTELAVNYGTESFPSEEEQHVFLDNNNNIIVRYFEREQQEETCESPFTPFVKEQNMLGMDVNRQQCITLNETNNHNTLQQLQSSTNENLKKLVSTTMCSSSKFVLHTPTEIEKKIEEKAQWAGKRGRGRPRKKPVEDKKINKKNKSN